mmetsp:Transcript_9922/g.26996  ORF Transcript_9922/g.26996 Transcript_9922/m.26996 type:complete len:303 (-) Transcript_9922:75-983(-)
MPWSKDMPVGRGGSWRDAQPHPAYAAYSGGGAGSGMSTLHVSGFPPDCTDREMESFGRFLPGFVAAKAMLKGNPKLWVRFDSAASAMAAMPFIDGQPFDLREPSGLLWASVAKTDLNPDRSGRAKGPMCLAGFVDELLGLPSYSEQLEPQRPLVQAAPRAQAGKGALPPLRDVSGGFSGKRPDPGETSGQGWAKRPRMEGDEERAAPLPHRARVDPSQEVDTIVVIRPNEAGLNDDGVHEFFSLVEGYVALRRGGANCFVKFAGAEAARNAIAAAGGSGLTAEMARTNMNVNQATHYAEAEA